MGPLTADLINAGFHVHDIGTEKMSWFEFKCWVEQLPPVPTCAYYRATNPDWAWTPDTDLLSFAVYALQGANWQRAGGDESKKPELITRPSGTRRKPPEEGIPLDQIRDEMKRRRSALRKSREEK